MPVTTIQIQLYLLIQLIPSTYTKIYAISRKQHIPITMYDLSCQSNNFILQENRVIRDFRLTKDELTSLPCLAPQRQVGGAFACAKDVTIGNDVSSELCEGL